MDLSFYFKLLMMNDEFSPLSVFKGSFEVKKNFQHKNLRAELKIEVELIFVEYICLLRCNRFLSYRAFDIS